MAPGYCYELTRDYMPWPTAWEAFWDVVVYEPTGGERRVGVRRIDGSPAVVFECPDGRYRAHQVTG